MDDILESVMDDIRLAKKLYKEDRVTEAYFLIQNIDKFSEGLDATVKATVQRELRSPQIESLREEGLRNAGVLALFESKDDWNDWTGGVGSNEDVVVSIHKEEERGQYYFKVEGRVNCDMISVIAALLEHDLHKFWLPLCSSTQKIATISPSRRIMHTKLDFTLVQKECIYTS
jgi:hypothetical protein